MEKADVKEIVIKRVDGTEEVIENGLVIQIVGKDISVSMRNIKPIDLCKAGVGLVEIIKQANLANQYIALLDYYNAQGIDIAEKRGNDGIQE